jgi:FHA domain-containing protein
VRDEELRALEQAAARGDSEAAEQLLASRYRRGELEEGHLELAAYLGFEPALTLRPDMRPLATLETQPWADGLGRFGRAIQGRALLGLARELSPRPSAAADFEELSLIPLRPSATPEVLSPGQTLLIGRSRSSDLTLEDDRVSRRHCELELRRDGRLLVRDLGSTNGTFIGGEPLLEEASLHVGQILRLGTGALLEVRGGMVDPSPLERCLAAVQAALDDPRSSTTRAASEAANALSKDDTSPELAATLAAAYAVAGADVLAGLYLEAVPPERCRQAARRALLPWVLSCGPLPSELPNLESRWRSQRLSNTSWSELCAAVEDAFEVRVWAPLGECNPRRHTQLVVQRTDEGSGVELLHLVDLQGIDPGDLPSLNDWTEIRHPHLAAVHEVETRHLLAFYPPCWCAREEFSGGIGVKGWLEEQTPSQVEIARLGAELAGALEPLLAVVERWHLATLTPGDVVIGPEGGLWRGLVARAASSALEDLHEDTFRHREMHIDLRFMTPEQAVEASRAEPPTVVVYQLGAILYTLLAGRPPFPRESPLSARVLLEVLDRPPQPLRDLVEGIDPELEALVLACLAKEPGQRPGSPQALEAALEAWIQSQT